MNKSKKPNEFANLLRAIADKIDTDPSFIDSIFPSKTKSTSHTQTKEESHSNIFSMYSELGEESLKSHLQNLKISEIRNLIKSNGLGLKSNKKDALITKVIEYLNKRTEDVFLNL